MTDDEQSQIRLPPDSIIFERLLIKIGNHQSEIGNVNYE
jgi:hypothetical protein